MDSQSWITFKVHSPQEFVFIDVKLVTMKLGGQGPPFFLTPYLAGILK